MAGWLASSPYGLNLTHIWACLDCVAHEAEASREIAREAALAHVRLAGHTVGVTHITSELLVPVATELAPVPLRYGPGPG